MSTQLTLTAAEVAYLLSLSDPDRTAPARTLLSRLGITLADTSTEPASPEILDAGLGSLALRGHVIVGDRTATGAPHLTLSPDTAAVADAIASATIGVELGLGAGATADAAVLLDSGSIRIAVAPRLFRCVEVTSLDTSMALSSQLEAMAQAFLAEHRPGVAVAVMHAWPVGGPSAGGSAVGGSAASVTAGIAVDEQGRWYYTPDPDNDTSEEVPSALHAWQAFADRLRMATSG